MGVLQLQLPLREGLPPLPEQECSQIAEQCRRMSQPARDVGTGASVVLSTTTTILNTLSRVHASFHSLQHTQLFVLTNGRLLGHIPNGAWHTPDIVSYSANSSLLWEYSQALCSKPSGELLQSYVPFWGEVTSVAIVKRAVIRQPHPSNYCDTLLRHRPDLARGVGLDITQNGFQIWEVTASGYSSTQQHDWADISTLQAFVATVYDLSSDRYTSISFVPKSVDLWVLSHDDTAYDLIPFHASHFPGRGTWVAIGFETANPQKQLIFKFYWKDCDEDWDEGEFYRAAHQGGTIPGLAKPFAFVRTGFTSSTSDDDGDKKKELVFLILDVVCKPLNRCSSVLEILDAVYDALETHREMCTRGVIHGDISFGNIALPQRKGVSPSRLLDRAVTSSADMGLPTSMLFDLDSAVKMSDESSTSSHNRGTPMFMSYDLGKIQSSSPSLLSFVDPSIAETLQILVSAVELRQGLPQPFLATLEKSKAELLDLLSNLSYQASAKEDRLRHWCSSQPLSDSRGDRPARMPLHEPQHDVESMLWLLWFLLARANPVGAQDPPEIFHRMYNDFCTKMFVYSSTLGNNRNHFDPSHTLHPSLSDVTLTLNYMRLLILYTPSAWKRAYGDTLPWDFFHKLMQFWILADKQKVLDSGTLRAIQLDTTAPRPATVDLPPFADRSSFEEANRSGEDRQTADEILEVQERVDRVPPELRERYERCFHAAQQALVDISCSKKWYHVEISPPRDQQALFCDSQIPQCYRD